MLSGAATMAEVAAHGRARGYIYVPAGDDPAPGPALFHSPAFRSLCRSAIDRGGTVLAFLPEDVASANAAGAPQIDGVIWLGAAPKAAGLQSPWKTLGTLLPPGSDPHPEHGVRPRPPIVRGASRRMRTARERRRYRVLVAMLIAVFLAALGLAAFVLGSDGEVSFLPDNDSIWLTPRSPNN